MQLLQTGTTLVWESRFYGSPHLCSPVHVTNDPFRARCTTPQLFPFVPPPDSPRALRLTKPDRSSLCSLFASPAYSQRSLPSCGSSSSQRRFFPIERLTFATVRPTATLAIASVADPFRFAVINLILFQGFVLYTHYRRELADRRMYLMRAELKGGWDSLLVGSVID